MRKAYVPSRRGTLLLALIAPCSAGFGAIAEGAHEAMAEQVEQGQRVVYAEQLARLDAEVAASPEDAVTAVERCRFIGHFAASEDPVVESAYEDQQACTEALKASAHAQSPFVQLYLIDQLWGDEARALGEGLIDDARAWSPRQRAALYEKLATQYSYSGGDTSKAGVYALQAIGLDPGVSVRQIAAEHLKSIGALAEAVRTLEATPREKWAEWELASAVKFLVSIDAAEAAKRLVESNAQVPVEPGTRVLLARGLFAVGATTAGREMLELASSKTTGDEPASIQTLRELFEIERDHGSAQSASAAYRRLRAAGYEGDPFGRHRLSLLLAHPSAVWSPADALGFAALALALTAFALLSLAIVVPVHYASAVVRLRGRAPKPLTPSAPWSLRHVAYAFSAMLFAEALALFWLDYPGFHSLFADTIGLASHYEVESTQDTPGSALILASVLTLIALLPIFRGVDLRAVFLGHWSIRKSVTFGVVSAIVILALDYWIGLGQSESVAAERLDTETMRAMRGILRDHGLVVLLLFAALLVPVVEEILFRGVLLRGMSRYFAVWVAVVLQAAFFMVVHEDLHGYPVIFGIGVVAAVLAMRSGGLLAPIVLHMTNNLAAGLWITQLPALP